MRLKSLSGKRILVVDDLTLVRLTIGDTLTLAGADVLDANNGKRALELAAQEKPDLILCDYQMPGMDGLEVLSRLKSDPETSSISFVLITAYLDRGLASRAMAAGAYSCIDKESYPQELVDRISEALPATSETG
jgi:CheY-like chemotaxis protein